MIRREWMAFGLAALVHVVGVPVAYTMAPEITLTNRVARPRGSYEVDVDIHSAFLPERIPTDEFRMDRQHLPGIGEHDSRMPNNPNYNPNLPRTLTRRGGGPAPDDPNNLALSAMDGGQPSSNDGFNPDGEFSNEPGAGEVWGAPGGEDIPYWALPGAPGIFHDAHDGPGAPTRTKDRQYDPDAPTHAVSDAVLEKDKKLGLDFPGRGPIRAAFVSATYGSDAPYDCQAVFGLSVSPAGTVTNVTYISHTGGTAGTWQAVGKAAHGQLKSAKLVMKSAYKKGATVSVTITSKKKTPGGGTSRDGATINFDVADLGAKATRLVTAFVAPIPVK